MSDLYIITFLVLAIMNILLWIWIVWRSKSEHDIVRIIGKALKKGEKEHGYNRTNYYPQEKIIYLHGYASIKDCGEESRLIRNRMNALCNYLGVKIEVRLAQSERYVVVKRDKKAK